MKKITFLTLVLVACMLGKLAVGQIKKKQLLTDNLFSSNNVPNTGISILVVQNGKRLYSKSFGLADIEHSIKATSATNYRIASVTKPFTAMAILMLRDEGKLKLEDPLTKFFPKTAAYGSSVTIRQMLNHTSGLVDYGNLVNRETADTLTDIDVLHLLEQQDSTRFKPGSRFAYSNSAYVLLGLIVEKVAGLSFSNFVKQRIFEPLQMKNSTLNSRGGIIVNRAYGYNLKNGKLAKEDQSIYSYLLGDGGIYSSIDDFYKWDQALFSTKLVSAETLKEIFLPSSNETPEIAYGYGWYIEQKNGLQRMSHSGGTTGFSSYYVRYPEKKLSIVIFANQDEGLALGPYVEAIEKIYLNTDPSTRRK